MSNAIVTAAQALELRAEFNLGGAEGMAADAVYRTLESNGFSAGDINQARKIIEPVATPRKTSIYALEVPDHISTEVNPGALMMAMRDVLDDMATADRVGSWTQFGKAVVLFRCATDDALAISIAAELSGRTEGTMLTTGLGVNTRTVTEF